MKGKEREQIKSGKGRKECVYIIQMKFVGNLRNRFTTHLNLPCFALARPQKYVNCSFRHPYPWPKCSSDASHIREEAY